jgi:hypothetical protein
VLGQHSADRLDSTPRPAGLLVGVGGGEPHGRVEDRSSSAAKKAEAAFNISFARRSSATSRLSHFSSADSSEVMPGRCSADHERFRLRSGYLLVVDEAGAVDTAALVAIQRRCEDRGEAAARRRCQAALRGRRRWGANRHRRAWHPLRPGRGRRFTSAWEGSASLRLRDGDPTVVDEYAKHGWLVDGGTPEQAEAAASRTWPRD